MGLFYTYWHFSLILWCRHGNLLFCMCHWIKKWRNLHICQAWSCSNLVQGGLILLKFGERGIFGFLINKHFMKRHSDVKMTWRWNTYISLAENAYDVIMSSPFVQFFKIINLSSSYDRLPDHNKFGLICIKESKVVGGRESIPLPQRLRMY